MEKETKSGAQEQEVKQEQIEEPQVEKSRRKLPLAARIAIGVLVAVLVIGAAGYGIFNYYYNQMNIQKAEDEAPADVEYFETDENTGNLEELDPNSIQLDSATAVENSKEVVNILLCGEEAIGGGRGRTDSIMIATINGKDNKLKLTSIMR
ncbi:MAG: hypothetical protein Q4D32_02765, partial [Eubacteriales bacterium]|nr:hypothetical protein [Eubacteriales bacterium]